jgi:cytochrome c-type biogenesis protein CcmH/NrfG
LKQSPLDGDAWWLLATCLRKETKWTEAVDAYDSVIRLAAPARRDKARYRAGTILQEQLGNHPAAIPYLEKYVEGSPVTKPLRAEALVRLAQSYMKTGQNGRAAKFVDMVLKDHPDSPSFQKSKQLKEQLR